MLSRDKFVHIYNGIYLTRAVADEGAAAAFRRRFSIPDDRSIVAQVCWMIPEKGVADLLDAARLVVARNPRALQRMMAGGLLDRGSISLRSRELMILRTCARCGAEYEWGVHIAVFGAKAQWNPEQIRSTVFGGASDAVAHVGTMTMSDEDSPPASHAPKDFGPDGSDAPIDKTGG